MHLLLALLLLVVPVMGDGFPNDEDIPATFSSNKVVGDVYPQGADLPFQRLLNSHGGGFVTMNTDPAVVGTDPLTGEDAPVGTDVGFSGPGARAMLTNVWNGDFSQGPPDANAPISDYNPLPYWTWTPGDNMTLTYEAEATAASGYVIVARSVGTSTNGELVQWIRIPRSQGQQYRVMLSGYFDDVGSGSTPTMVTQFYEGDATTAIGSSSGNVVSAGLTEAKFDLGLVPPTASYLRLGVTFPDDQTFRLYEVRAAFLPAEATIGLKSQTSFGAATTTTEKSIVNAPVPPGTLVPGSVYRITITGVVTSSAANVVTFRIRVGTGTTSGNIAASINPTATTTASADPFSITGLLTVRSSGGSGTVFGALSMVGGAAQPFAVATRQGSGDPASTSTSTITVDTTVSNYVSFTAVTAAATTSITFTQAFIECVMAS